jgi:hypothetical protein
VKWDSGAGFLIFSKKAWKHTLNSVSQVRLFAITLRSFPENSLLSKPVPKRNPHCIVEIDPISMIIIQTSFGIFKERKKLK